VPPTPITAKKRRILKAEKRLGEKVPWELIERGQKQKHRRKIAPKGMSEDRMMYKASKFAKRIDEDGSIISNFFDGDKAPKMKMKSQKNGRETEVHIITLGDITKRESSHWLWDKGGLRWESDNLHDVIRNLRSL
jgi:hypothetical protein